MIVKHDIHFTLRLKSLFFPWL